MNHVPLSVWKFAGTRNAAIPWSWKRNETCAALIFKLVWPVPNSSNRLSKPIRTGCRWLSPATGRINVLAENNRRTFEWKPHQALLKLLFRRFYVHCQQVFYILYPSFDISSQYPLHSIVSYVLLFHGCSSKQVVAGSKTVIKTVMEQEQVYQETLCCPFLSIQATSIKAQMWLWDYCNSWSCWFSLLTLKREEKRILDFLVQNTAFLDYFHNVFMFKTSMQLEVQVSLLQALRLPWLPDVALSIFAFSTTTLVTTSNA